MSTADAPEAVRGDEGGPKMPLSDHEQRLLDEIEQALCAEDPKFASAVRSAGARSRARRLVVLSCMGVLVGLGLVLVGLMSTLVPLSVAGFVLVVGSCGALVRALRPHESVPVADDARRAQPLRKGPQPRQGGLRGRMEDRLRKRFDEN